MSIILAVFRWLVHYSMIARDRPRLILGEPVLLALFGVEFALGVHIIVHLVCSRLKLSLWSPSGDVHSIVLLEFDCIICLFCNCTTPVLTGDSTVLLFSFSFRSIISISFDWTFKPIPLFASIVIFRGLKRVKISFKNILCSPESLIFEHIWSISFLKWRILSAGNDLIHD